MERSPQDLSELRDHVAWLDVLDPSPEDFALIAEELQLHPLAIEDALVGGQRPKLEEYPGHLFIVFFALESRTPDVLDERELAIFVVPNAIVTVHRGDFAARQETEGRFRAGRATTPAAILHDLLDRVVDRYFPIVDQFGDRVELLERLIVDDPRGRGLQTSLSELFSLKSDLLRVRRLIVPAREVLASLMRTDGAMIERERLPYFQDIYDHIVRVTDEIDTFRDLSSNVIDAHLAAASNRLNEVMKVLTSVATILLVMSVITSFFGQNFEQLPYGSNGAFWLMIGSVVASGIVLTFYFRGKGWL